MKLIQVYQCDYCPRHLTYDYSMRAHEKKCYHNPINRSCITCKWFTIEKTVAFTNDRSCKRRIDLSKKLHSLCNLWELNENGVGGYKRIGKYERKAKVKKDEKVN